LQDFYAVGYITSPKVWWLWVESNHQPFAYETNALPFELHSQESVSGFKFKVSGSIPQLETWNLQLET
jgi:hypothetical protein